MTDTVGAVYVRVYSDSSGFAKQLRKEGAKAGTKASTAFGKSFHDGATKDLNKLNLERVLSPKVEQWGRDFAKQVKIAEQSGKDADIKFSIGQIVSDDELRKLATRLNVTFAEVQSYVRKALPAAAKAGFKEIDNESAEQARKQKARDKERVDNWLKEMGRIRPLSDLWSDAAFRRVARKAGDELEKRLTPAIKESLLKGGKVDWLDFGDAEAKIRSFAKVYRISFADAERAIRKQMQNTLKQREDSQGWMSKARKQMKNLLTDSKHLDDSMKKVYRAFRRVGSGGFFDGMTTAIGVVIFAAYKMGKAVFSVLKGIASGIADVVGGLIAMVKASTSVGDFFSKLGGAAVSALGSLASSALSGAAGLAAIVTALAAMVAVLGAVAQLVSALIAGVVALGSALYYVVAQVAFLVPILGALGLGFVATAVGGWDAAGAVVALGKAVGETDPKKKAKAWKEYGEALKKLGPNARAAVEALKPLVEGFGDIKKVVGEALFKGMAASIGKAKPLIDALVGSLEGIAGAVGDVIDGFLELGADTVFMRDFNVMLQLTEDLIGSLGGAAKDFFAGFNSFFAAMAPVVKLFGEDIARMAKSFSDWAQSTGGQNAILEFFTTAREMGLLFWDLLKEVGGALHDLFTDPATVGAAKGFLTFLTEEVKKFRDWIAEVSANGQLKQWFADAAEVGKVLWSLMGQLVKLFAALLTPESILVLKLIVGWFISWVGAMVLLVNAVGTVLSVFVGFFQVVWGGLKVIGNLFVLVYDAVLSAVRAFNKARTAGKSFTDSVMEGIKAIKGAWDRFVAALRNIKWPSPPSWIGKAFNAVTGKSAAGGLFMGPTKRLIGEEGPEVVIPLHRPLSRVDPSVRSMAAMMRGSAGTAGVTTNSRQMTNYWTINTPSPDGRVVASQVVNRMAAMAG